MAGLRDTIAALVGRGTMLGQPFAQRPFLEAEPGREGLVEVTGFGANPGRLRMLKLVPENLRPGAPLVVVLHPCLQTAAGYARASGWTTLAAKHGFALLLPEQRPENNRGACFNWFEPEDNSRGSGEALSIRHMLDHMLAQHRLDRSRLYVTGLSAGGAMACVMLATYPEMFAAGAIFAGLPYRCAAGAKEALAAMRRAPVRSPSAWAAAVRLAAPQGNAWPAVAVWHGSDDNVVAPGNADEIVKQWRKLHGVEEAKGTRDTIAGHMRRTWHDPAGNVVVEQVTVSGLRHATPIDARGRDGEALGFAAPYVEDIGLGSTRRIAQGWGLLAMPGIAGGPEEQHTPLEAAPAIDRARSVPAPGRLHRFIAFVRFLLGRGKQPAPGALGGEGWTCESGWAVRDEDPASPGRPLLVGQASSGTGYGAGYRRRVVSRPLRIVAGQRLTYERRLELRAAVNIFTTAGFAAFVDDVEIDRETATFAVRTDPGWTAKSVDLARFAGRSVSLRFELTAMSNIFVEVSAKAWIRGIALEAG